VEDTRMVNMQLTNTKLIERGTRMLMNQTGIADYQEAHRLLLQHGSVKKAAESRRR
jgi:N-acetylmuramic acid 6-phosphate etherase